MNNTLKHYNNFILSFFKKNEKEDLIMEWMNSKNQTTFKKLLNKSTDKINGNPKRAKSAYLYFCDENRAVIRSKLGSTVTNKDIIKTLGIRWNIAKENGEINKYLEMAMNDKERYNQEKDNFSTKKKSTPQSLSSLKKSNHLNCYQSFCSKRRLELKKEFPNEKPREITKRLNLEWKNENTKQE